MTACDRQRGRSLSFFFPTHHPPAGRSARREPAAPDRTPGITQGLQLKGQPARNSNTTIGTGAHSGPACITKWGVLIMATTKVSSITAGRFRQLLPDLGFVNCDSDPCGQVSSIAYPNRVSSIAILTCVSDRSTLVDREMKSRAGDTCLAHSLLGRDHRAHLFCVHGGEVA